jgi:iron complex outermembrane receptor protein
MKTLSSINKVLFKKNKLQQALIIALCGLVLPAQAATEQKKDKSTDEIQVLATTKVQTQEESATSPVIAYVAHSSATGTKTDTPLIEIAQSISVVGAQEIQAYGAHSVMEALAYTAGVSNASGFNPSKEEPVMRGFAQRGGIFRDGLYYGGAWGTRQETFGLERVEFLKGASSVLYGASVPGGLINSITKRPHDAMVNEISVEVGNFSRKQLTLDLGGDITDSSELLWRFTALKRESDTQVDYVNDNRDYIAPSLTWNISDKTQLTLFGLYQYSDTIFIMALPEKGTLLPNSKGKIPRNRFIGDPNWESGESTTKAISYMFTHEFSDNLTFNNSSRWQNNETVWQLSWNNGFIENSDSIVSRGGYGRIDDISILTTDVNLEYTFVQGELTHKFLVGMDYRTEEWINPGTVLGESLIIQDIDVFNPIYIGTGFDFSQATLSEYSKGKATNQGVYLQDQIALGENWRFNLGTRYAKVNSSDNDKDDKWVSNAGVVYLADNGLAPFVSYSQSFEAEYSVTDNDGIRGRTKPSEGEQFELGMRWQPLSEDLLISAAVYQLTKSNVSKAHPDRALANQGIVVQTGEVQSRGFEFEAKGRLTDNVEFTSAYTYTDAQTTQSTDITEIGLRTAAVPYHQASLWLDKSFNDFAIEGLKLGVGIRYLSEKPITGAAYSIPASTQFDARASYKIKAWEMALTASNITDKDDFSECSFGDCSYTKARTITANVAYHF